MTIQSRLALLLRQDLARYFIASLAALAADVATLSACLRAFHLSLAWSATTGFTIGALLAYFLSIRWVFRQRALADSPVLELLTFVGIGVAGLGVTQLVLWIGVTALGLIPELAKLAAACATFAFNYIARKSLLFATTRRTRRASGPVT